MCTHSTARLMSTGLTSHLYAVICGFAYHPATSASWTFINWHYMNLTGHARSLLTHVWCFKFEGWLNCQMQLKLSLLDFEFLVTEHRKILCPPIVEAWASCLSQLWVNFLTLRLSGNWYFKRGGTFWDDKDYYHRTSLLSNLPYWETTMCGSRSHLQSINQISEAPISPA